MIDFKEKYERMLEEMDALVNLTNKHSVLILIQHSNAEDVYPCIPSVRESISNIIGFVSLGDEGYLPYLIEKSEGIIDTLVVDVDPKRDNSERIKHLSTRLAIAKGMKVSYYSNYASWVSSAMAFISEIDHQKCISNCESKHLLVGRNTLATRMVQEMIGRGMDVFLLGVEYPKPVFPVAGGELELHSRYIHIINPGFGDHFDTLLGCELQKKCTCLEQLEALNFHYVYDVGISNFTSGFITKQRENGAKVYRLDDRAGVSGTVVNLMETSELIENVLGKTKLGNITIVSGGYIGESGDVVVDNYKDPRSVLGIANGDGTFKSELSIEEVNCIKKIEKLL